MVEYREAQRGSSTAWEMSATPADYGAPIETQPITFSGSELVCKIHLSAPVENSWMFITVIALDAAGREAAACKLNMAYYHGLKNGRQWQTGGHEAAGSLILPGPGGYRFQFAVEAGEGASAAPATAHAAKPMRITLKRSSLGASRWRVSAFVVMAIVGGALLLRSMVSSCLPESDPGHRLRKPSGDRMVFLDGLRGIACVGVLLCHLFVPEISAISASLKTVIPAWVPALLQHGDLGVEVFFVLSGFVIAYSLRDHRVSGSLAWRFAVRRSLRLDPPYLFTLVLAIGVWAVVFRDSFYEVGEKFEGAPGILANAFYLQDILRYPAIFSVAWTLCLEIQFYLAFVLLAGIAQWLRDRIAGRAVAGAPRSQWLAPLMVFMPLGLLSFAMWYLGLAAFTFPGTWFRFFLGVLVFWTIAGRMPRAALYGFTALLLVVSFVTRDIRGGTAALTAGVIFLVGVSGQLTQWLSGRLWQYLGRISYSLYLLHVVIGIPFINWIWAVVPQSAAMALALFPAGIVVSVAFAHLFHVFFERPSLALSRLIHY